MSTIKANDLTNTTGGIPTVKGQKLIPTAWVNFNGTGTVAIRDSENVSSITDSSIGNFVVNLVTNMADANYVVIGTASRDSASELMNLSPYSYTTSSVSVTTQYVHASSIDCVINNVTIMGGQA